MNFDDFDIWWRERGDDVQLSQMSAFLEKALCDKASRDIEYSIRWRLARWHHFAAMKNAQHRTVSHAHFVRGAQNAKRAIQLQKTVQRAAIEADFWHAINAMEAARLRHIVSASRVLPRVTRTLQRIADVDEEFHFAGALRVLGRLTHLKPKFLGGGAKRAVLWFQDALEIAPQNSTTLLYYAQALRDADEPEEARKMLQKIVSQPLDDEWKWEQARDKTLAARLLESSM